MRTAHDWRDTETNEGEVFDPVVVEERGTRLSIGRDREDWGSALTLWSREEVDALIARLQSVRHRMLPRDYIERIEAIARCGQCPPGPPPPPDPEWVQEIARECGEGSMPHLWAKRVADEGCIETKTIPVSEWPKDVEYGSRPILKVTTPKGRSYLLREFPKLPVEIVPEENPEHNGPAVSVIGSWTPDRYCGEPIIRMPGDGDEHLTLTAKHTGAFFDPALGEAFHSGAFITAEERRANAAVDAVKALERDLVAKLERAEEDEGSEE